MSKTVKMSCVIIIMHEGTEGGATSDTRPAHREPGATGATEPTEAAGPAKATEAAGASEGHRATWASEGQ